MKLTIFLTDLDNFATVNEVMAEYCNEPYPARAAVQVAALPKGVDIEADGQDTFHTDCRPPPDYHDMSPEQIQGCRQL